MYNSSPLRPHRAALVREAEKVARKAPRRADFKTQLSQLIAVCHEAECKEEIINYIHYQIGRGVGVWREIGKDLIDAAAAGMKDIEEKYHVSAWRLFGTYFKRAYIYYS